MANVELSGRSQRLIEPSINSQQPGGGGRSNTNNNNNPSLVNDVSSQFSNERIVSVGGVGYDMVRSLDLYIAD